MQIKNLKNAFSTRFNNTFVTLHLFLKSSGKVCGWSFLMLVHCFTGFWQLVSSISKFFFDALNPQKIWCFAISAKRWSWPRCRGWAIPSKVFPHFYSLSAAGTANRIKTGHGRLRGPRTFTTCTRAMNATTRRTSFHSQKQQQQRRERKEKTAPLPRWVQGVTIYRKTELQLGLGCS